MTLEVEEVEGRRGRKVTLKETNVTYYCLLKLSYGLQSKFFVVEDPCILCH